MKLSDLIVTVLIIASALIAAPDTFKRPFSTNSIWNRQLPVNTAYDDVPGLEKTLGSINFENRWTTFVYSTDASSRKAKLYIHPYTLHGKRQSKAVTYTNNPDSIEDALRAASVPSNSFPANYYATTMQSPPGKRTFPYAVHDVHSYWRDEIYVPNDAFSPSPDSDGQLAIWQPDGKVLEVYCAVVCKNGDIIGTMAGFTDPVSDGSGLENGRTASLIPNYAGLIREGEVTAGVIDHALSCTFPPNLLTTQAVYPAMAFDMNDRYKGPVPMGSLLAIPLSADLSAMKLSAGGRIIAEAAQRYGIYVVDRGGAGLTIKADQNASDALTQETRADIYKIVRELKLVRGPR
ncbi:MAG: hypothetical protein AABZ39_07065 [Spirochaetota bacterium]